MPNSSSCFDLMDSGNMYKTASVTFSIFSIVFMLASIAVVIWYERFGSDKRRTLINILVTALGYNNIGLFVVVQGPIL